MCTNNYCIILIIVIIYHTATECKGCSRYDALLLLLLLYMVLIFDPAIAEHIGQLLQRVTDTEAEVSRLQTRLEDMKGHAEQQAAAAVDAERQQLRDEFDSQLAMTTQQRK